MVRGKIGKKKWLGAKLAKIKNGGTKNTVLKKKWLG